MNSVNPVINWKLKLKPVLQPSLLYKMANNIHIVIHVKCTTMDVLIEGKI